MSGEQTAVCRFLPWVRYGTIASLGLKAVLGKNKLYSTGSTAPPLKTRVEVPIKLRLRGSEEISDINVPLSLYGPGDVIGIDPREIVRTQPRPQTTDFPPHLFPFIEFDRPDFPWMFTPAGPDSDNCLRPWIVLVVVRKQRARLTPDPRKPLPVLTCPVTELPDLDESWAWVHGQYVGGTDEHLEGLNGVLNTKPHQNVSRLLCPRKLEPRQGGTNGGYYACLVPAFETGRRAGLGLPVAADENLKNAWDVTATSMKVELPVYYHWEFGAGAGGSFEELVDRLQFIDAEKLPPRAGEPVERLMNMQQPFPGENNQNATLDIPAALHALAEVPSTWIQKPERPGQPEQKAEAFKLFQRRLQVLLESAGSKSNLPAPPPIYGCWHAYDKEGRIAGPDMKLDEKAPGWLRDLNLDPRYRVAAALGTRVIQHQQEQLVAAAWEQAAALKAVNQWLRQKQLGRSVTASVHQKRLGSLSPEAFQQITAPLVVPKPSGRGVPFQVRATEGGGQAPTVSPAGVLSSAVVSAPFRRMARPLGSVARQRAAVGMAGTGVRPSAVAALATGLMAPQAQLCSSLMQIVPPPGATAGAVAISGYPCEAPPADSQREEARKKLLEQMKEERLEEIKPDATFGQEATARLELPKEAESHERSDALQPFRFSPSFPQPMFEPLRDLFQDMLVPGMDKIPYNSVILLKANARFIESYMVGLNHEFSRELLWREFPTHLGGTYFRRFWGSGSDKSAPDIPRIGDWNNEFGSNLDPERGKNLYMLLIRGDLLLRHPNAIIYAQKAPSYDPNSGPSTELETSGIKFPLTRIDPVPGVTLLGFVFGADEKPDQSPGWFFVFEEHPTEMRFGLDESRKQGDLVSWRELAWNIEGTEDGDVQVTNGYVSVSGKIPKPESSAKGVWGNNGADMAYITLRPAYRLLVHSSIWHPDNFVPDRTARKKETIRAWPAKPSQG